MICPPPYSGDQIKENEMGGTCGTYCAYSVLMVKL